MLRMVASSVLVLAACLMTCSIRHAAAVRLERAPTMDNFIEMSTQLESLQRANSVLAAQLAEAKGRVGHATSTSTSTRGQVNGAVFDQLERIAARQVNAAAGQAPPAAVGNATSTARAASGDGGGGSGAAAAEQQVFMAMAGTSNTVESGLSTESPDTSRLRFIPYGKTVPQVPGVEYIIASGKQECIMCLAIVSEAYTMGPQYVNLCGYHLRDSVNTPMCHAQAHVLQSCPEFVNDWCYQDFGGSQMLRSPCPSWLKCHYCLGLNPLHCQHGYGAFMPVL